MSSSAAAVLEPPTSPASFSSPNSTPIDDQTVASEDGWTSPSQPVAKSSSERKKLPSSDYEEQPTSTSNIASAEAYSESGVRRLHKRTLRPEISQEARQWLTGDLELINQRAMLFCTEQAKRMHVPISGIQLSVKRSWEGEFRELVLQVFVEANFAQSLALWDSIGEAIQGWGAKQSAKRRRLLNEQYAVFVEPASES